MQIAIDTVSAMLLKQPKNENNLLRVERCLAGYSPDESYAKANLG